MPVSRLDREVALLYKSYTLSELGAVAREIKSLLPGNKIVLFSGEMGSGKTTLIKELCKLIGDGDSANSPSYSVVNEYLLNGKKVVHFDLFRLKDKGELLDLGFFEYLDSSDFAFIEWPELALSLLESDCLDVTLESAGENLRRIHVRIRKV